ncbi:hypothetical protein B0H66DRAFT_531648 [Apodospora peruviana]|uniref:DUF7729 domain-containing protein n=1 Tax=Apodospora peruviana TaxID=516989 RepID=A0AAE0IC89_9PEZI|nr:hypothetical protein B0H66DRAFT_531648 [Apodospora peruviana]
MASDASALPSLSRPKQLAALSRRPPPKRWAILFLVLVCFFCQIAAATADAAEPVETLEIDARIPLRENGKWLFLSQEELDLRRVKKRAPAATTTFSIAVQTVTQTSTTSTVPASPLPSPLDGGLSANFTGENGQRKCPQFINSFLGDETFKRCYPFSLLLQGSQSFFNAEKSLVAITQVLDASCAANATFCNDYMSQLASNMTSSDNCGEDFDLGNSVVVKAYNAMRAYAPIYTASCLKDAQTSMYCFANAVTNLTNPTNTYFYYLPLNRTLPGSTVPGCSQCLQQTMNVFHASTANRKQQITSTYESAAQQVNTICGPSFVNETLADEVVSSGSSRSIPASRPSFALLAALAVLPLIPWLI